MGHLPESEFSSSLRVSAARVGSNIQRRARYGAGIGETMKRVQLAALVVGVMLSGPAAWAQEAAAPVAAPVIPEDQQATKEQLARLFEVMRIKQQMSSVTRTMPALVQQQFQQQLEQMKRDTPQMASMTEDQQQAMNKVMGSFMERAMNLYPVDEMLADMTVLYQKHLSRPDVEATIVFYGSPAGQHVLDMVPAIMQEFLPTVMQKSQERMKPLIMQMQKEMVEIGSPAAGKPAQK
jgi:hypothetical protein